MQDYIVKPTKSLIFRNYFVVFTAILAFFAINDFSLRGSGTLFNEGIAFFFIMSIFIIFLLLSSHVKIEVYRDRINFSVFGIKTSKFSLKQIKIIKSKLILSSLKTKDAMWIQKGLFYFTISDLWQNYNFLKSDVVNNQTT